MKKQILKTILKPFLLPVAIGIVAWEELAYKPLKQFLTFLKKVKLFIKFQIKLEMLILMSH